MSAAREMKFQVTLMMDPLESDSLDGSDVEDILKDIINHADVPESCIHVDVDFKSDSRSEGIKKMITRMEAGAKERGETIH